MFPGAQIIYLKYTDGGHFDHKPSMSTIRHQWGGQGWK